MKVLVTGGTGFVGSHSVASLCDAGHSVRLLVRSSDRVPSALAPLGVGLDNVEVVIGDVTDEAAVRRALRDCDAIVHAASVYSLDVRRGTEIERTNVAGTERVLRLSVEAGLDPIVHVSSIAALLDQGGILGPATEPGNPPGVYAWSKAESDRLARWHQAQAAPVVLVYPASVWGAHDPHEGESSRAAKAMLRGTYRLSIRGGIVVSDVSAVAALHRAVMEPGRGPRRYFVPSVMIEFQEWMARFSALTGRRLRTTVLPTGLVLRSLQAADRFQRLVPVRLPIDYQGAYAHSRFQAWEGWDDSRASAEFGIQRPDANRLFAETIHWLYEQGQISARLAGRLGKSDMG